MTTCNTSEAQLNITINTVKLLNITMRIFDYSCSTPCCLLTRLIVFRLTGLSLSVNIANNMRRRRRRKKCEELNVTNLISETMEMMEMMETTKPWNGWNSATWDCNKKRRKNMNIIIEIRLSWIDLMTILLSFLPCFYHQLLLLMAMKVNRRKSSDGEDNDGNCLNTFPHYSVSDHFAIFAVAFIYYLLIWTSNWTFCFNSAIMTHETDHCFDLPWSSFSS